MPAARGPFDVSMTPQESDESGGGAALGRMILDKTYHGELSGSGSGQMLTCMTEIEGSAGYVALEVVNATLARRSGSFVLQHFGLMSQGDSSLQVTVVPDSATGELIGLTGELAIEASDGGHRYVLSYELPGLDSDAAN